MVEHQACLGSASSELAAALSLWRYISGTHRLVHVVQQVVEFERGVVSRFKVGIQQVVAHHDLALVDVLWDFLMTFVVGEHRKGAFVRLTLAFSWFANWLAWPSTSWCLWLLGPTFLRVLRKSALSCLCNGERTNWILLLSRVGPTKLFRLLSSRCAGFLVFDSQLSVWGYHLLLLLSLAREEILEFAKDVLALVLNELMVLWPLVLCYLDRLRGS